MKIDIQKSLLVVLGCVVAFLVWQLCNTQVRLSSFKKQIGKLQLDNQFFEEKLSKDSVKIAEQEQIIISQKDAIELGILEIENLKKIKGQVKTITEIRIDSVPVPYTETIYISDTIYPKGVIEVPKRFNLTKEHYSFNGLILKEGLLVDSIVIPNEMKLTIGNKSGGIFRKSIPIVKLENTNPYLSTIDMKNVIIEDEKKFYDRKVFWLGVGLIGGIIIMK
jgi:hypothetical protein